MKVFVTGATGFIGTAVVKELISNGHQVVGLSRSDSGSEKLKNQGADNLRGTIDDLEVLKKGASESDGVIHLAFEHDFANFEACCAKDRAAISALADGLIAAGPNRPLVMTSGTMMLPMGKVGKEDDAKDDSNPLAAARGQSETLTLGLAKKGVRSSVVRLPPTTYGDGFSGFTGPYINLALQKGVAGYIGEGENTWSTGHRDDAAVVYRLALEKGKPGSIFHPIGEEAVPLKSIAEAVGKELGLPVQSFPVEKAQEQFEWFYFGLIANNKASSLKTQQELDWKPVQPGLIETIPIIVKAVKGGNLSLS